MTVAVGSAVTWRERYPERWSRELDDLRQAGWSFTVTKPSGGPVGLMVRYPLGDGLTARLRIRFGPAYPWFPPSVEDVDSVLAGARHRQPVTGVLCLVHDEQWDTDWTVAHLLKVQMPRLLAAAELGPVGVDVGGGGVAALEMPVPELVGLSVSTRMPPIIVPDVAVPAGVDQGALLCRFSVRGTRLGVGLVELVLGTDVRVATDLPEREVGDFPVVVAGRWVRDPDFRPGESAQQVWRRVAKTLRPLAVDEVPSEPPSSVGQRAKVSTAVSSTEVVEVVGLLVPDEIGYRTRGESWVFLMRSHTTARVSVLSPGSARSAVGGSGDGERDTGRMPGSTPAPPRRRWTVGYRPTQPYSRALVAERTPQAGVLASRSAVVVGLGALGMPLAQDLAQAGVGRLVCLDRDRVDPTTGTRQPAALTDAGLPKAFLAHAFISAAAPYCDVDGVTGSLESVWERHADEAGAAARAMVLRALVAADLVVDATANPAATRLLGSMRRQLGKPFLVVSGTAGGWGGVVTLLSGEGACWGCVEHARADGAVPVPPADSADGWFTPTRCAEPTFRGTRQSMQQVAMHASAVAANFLAGTPMVGNYWVASMRTPGGDPSPVAWSSTTVPVHPRCDLHAADTTACTAGDAANGA